MPASAQRKRPERAARTLNIAAFHFTHQRVHGSSFPRDGLANRLCLLRTGQERVSLDLYVPPRGGETLFSLARISHHRSERAGHYRLRKNPSNCHPERSEGSCSECFQGNARFFVAAAPQNDSACGFFRSLFSPAVTSPWLLFPGPALCGVDPAVRPALEAQRSSLAAAQWDCDAGRYLLRRSLSPQTDSVWARISCGVSQSGFMLLWLCSLVMSL